VTVTNDPVAASEGCHGVVICTDWAQFRTLDYKSMYEKMQKPACLFDGRNIVDLHEMEQIGFVVRILGK
jgi:UDPglucose 6-dehydrogenase